MTQISKPRYALLDALRGVAAIGVVLLHFGIATHTDILVPHGYLAVDFFFILSGFVISHAYANRVADLGLFRFCELRVKRLLPMSICGVVIAAVYLSLRWRFQPGQSDDLPHLLGASGLNLFLIPKLWRGRATGHDLYPADGPLWSLLMELAINIVWAAWFFRKKSLSLLRLSLAGCAVFALFAWRHGDANVGWVWSTFGGGMGRVTFGFFAGVLLWRFRLKSRLPAIAGWTSGAALVGVLCLPVCAWWVDVLLVAIVFPALVYFAAAADFSAEPIGFRLLGEVSYPLYAIHMPLLMAIASVFAWRHPGSQIGRSGYWLCVPILGLAYLAGRFYDVPVRRWLSKPLRQSSYRLPMRSWVRRVERAL